MHNYFINALKNRIIRHILPSGVTLIVHTNSFSSQIHLPLFEFTFYSTTYDVTRFHEVQSDRPDKTEKRALDKS